MQMPEPQKEHHWLHKLVGDWTFEGECSMGPDQPPMKNIGKETVRSLDGFWTIGEGTGAMPDGGTMHSIMTLGYDPQSKQFVGSFVAGCMTHFWQYIGTLDASEKVLTLDTEGPSFAGDGSMAKYQDIIEFQSDDQRTLSSRYMGPDGNWIPFMKAHYTRVK
jgi:hypothetical protein